MQLQILTRTFLVALAALLTLALPVSAVGPGEIDTDSPLVDILMSDGMTREEMVGLYGALAGGGFEPPDCVPGGEMFDDVPASHLFCPWIEELARSGITGGCDADNYCPGNPVSRAQMASFIVKTLKAAAPMWAVVSTDAEIAAQSGGISVEQPQTIYHVKFPRSLQGRAIVATPLAAGTLESPNGNIDAKVSPCGNVLPDQTGDCGIGDNTPRDALVAMLQDGSLTNAGFFIAVLP